MRPSFVKRSNVTLYELPSHPPLREIRVNPNLRRVNGSGSVVQTRQLAIQEADELDAAVVDEAGADERLAEDRVAPELHRILERLGRRPAACAQINQ